MFRWINIITIMLLVHTCNGNWADLDRWIPPLYERGFTTFTDIYGNSYTGRVKDARAFDCQFAIYEREMGVFTPELYRSERDNVMDIKSEVAVHCSEFIDLEAISDAGGFEEYFTSVIDGFVWNGSRWEIDEPVCRNTFPGMTIDRILEVADLPRQAVYSVVTNTYEGWEVGEVYIQSVVRIETNTTYTNTWFDYTPYRDMGGTMAGVTNGQILGVNTVWTNVYIGGGSFVWTNVVVTNVVDYIADGFTSSDYGWKHVPEAFNVLIAKSASTYFTNGESASWSVADDAIGNPNGVIDWHEDVYGCVGREVFSGSGYSPSASLKNEHPCFCNNYNFLSCASFVYNASYDTSEIAFVKPFREVAHNAYCLYMTKFEVGEKKRVAQNTSTYGCSGHCDDEDSMLYDWNLAYAFNNSAVEYVTGKLRYHTYNDPQSGEITTATYYTYRYNSFTDGVSSGGVARTDSIGSDVDCVLINPSWNTASETKGYEPDDSRPVISYNRMDVVGGYIFY